MVVVLLSESNAQTAKFKVDLKIAHGALRMDNVCLL